MAPGLEQRHPHLSDIDSAEPDVLDDNCNVVPPPHLIDRKLVGVDGKWYDITDFIGRHPGGPIIEHFIGKDASQVFHGYGHESVLKYRKPVGTYTIPKRHPADEDFERLIKLFKEKGFYETDWTFYVKKSCFNALLLITVFMLVINFDQWYIHYFAAVILAFFWQQCAFVMHDFMHSQVFRNKYWDSFGGMLFGTVGFGISSHWWQDEHIVHHSMTNVVNVNTRFADPQMYEAVWAENEKLFPLFKKQDNKFFDQVKHVVQFALIKIQHVTFVPAVTLIGRFDIVTDSFLFAPEKRWYEWAAWPFHWLWVCCLLSQLPTWNSVITFYCIAAFVEGCFHFQLILSHYCKAFLFEHEFHNVSWYEFMIASNMNIHCPWWLDWYYGGLNYHIEHHLFPKMARKHLREAGTHVQEVCKKHGIEYDMCSFSMALWKTLVHLKTAGSHYKLDPR